MADGRSSMRKKAPARVVRDAAAYFNEVENDEVVEVEESSKNPRVKSSPRDSVNSHNSKSNTRPLSPNSRYKASRLQIDIDKEEGPFDAESYLRYDEDKANEEIQKAKPQGRSKNKEVDEDFSSGYYDKDRLIFDGKDVDAVTLSKVSKPFKYFSASGTTFLDSKQMPFSRELRRLLINNRKALEGFICPNSNVRGIIFYAGKEVPTGEVSDKMLAIEAWIDNQIPVIRDEEAKRIDKIDGIDHYYVKTSYDQQKDAFFRHYVPLNWLERLNHVDVSGTEISSDGVTALLAATGKSLKNLSLSKCTRVDDKCIATMVYLAKTLTKLDISHCPQLTPYGLLLLAEFSDPKVVEGLEHIRVAGNYPPNAVKALYVALDARGFRGKFEPMKFKINEDFYQDDDPIYLQASELAKNEIMDLSLRNIHKDAWKPFSARSKYDVDSDDDLLKMELDLKDQLINDFSLKVILEALNQYKQSRGRSIQWTLYKVDISNTYITEEGLSYLELCPDIRHLSVAGCRNVVDKGLANEKMRGALIKMHNLTSLDISDTKLSGRLLMDLSNLGLVSLSAQRCPISYFGIRALMKGCDQSLRYLSLSGCRFINVAAFQLLMKFKALQHLDLSNCIGLESIDVNAFASMNQSLAQSLETLDLGDIPNIDQGIAHKMINKVSEIAKKKKKALTVYCGANNSSLYPGEETDVASDPGFAYEIMDSTSASNPPSKSKPTQLTAFYTGYEYEEDQDSESKHQRVANKPAPRSNLKKDRDSTTTRKSKVVDDEDPPKNAKSTRPIVTKTSSESDHKKERNTKVDPDLGDDSSPPKLKPSKNDSDEETDSRPPEDESDYYEANFKRDAKESTKDPAPKLAKKPSTAKKLPEPEEEGPYSQISGDDVKPQISAKGKQENSKAQTIGRTGGKVTKKPEEHNPEFDTYSSISTSEVNPPEELRGKGKTGGTLRSKASGKERVRMEEKSNPYNVADKEDIDDGPS